jgi:ribosomal protein S18 acetylase RimI-like enzyme
VIFRRSKSEDLPALQALWQEVFGDPPAFTGRFYETFGADAAIVAEEDEKVVAMIHPLPVALAQNGTYSFGVYIYALATAPDYRGRGIASCLLTEAETAPLASAALAWETELTNRAGNTPAFSLLIPGEESLFAYYRARGYERDAKVVSQEAETYSAQLEQGRSCKPIFLKSSHKISPFRSFLWRFSVAVWAESRSRSTPTRDSRSARRANNSNNTPLPVPKSHTFHPGLTVANAPRASASSPSANTSSGHARVKGGNCSILITATASSSSSGDG